jgi:hypothetical protein
MTLTEAKAIADDPVRRSTVLNSLIVKAVERLEQTRSNGGVRNSERALTRLDRRIGLLITELREVRGVSL